MSIVKKYGKNLTGFCRCNSGNISGLVLTIILIKFDKSFGKLQILILFTTIVLIVCLNTSLGSCWHTFMDIYSDENGVQFAQSMIYNYQQELWENNWGHCPEMDACQTEIRHREVDTPMQYEKK